MLELALNMPPTLGYVGLTLAIPVFLTALIAVASALLFVLAAALGVSLDSRFATTLTIAPLVALLAWGAQACFSALRRRLPLGPVVSLRQIRERGLQPNEVGPKAFTLATMEVQGVRVAPGWVVPAKVFAELGTSLHAEAIAQVEIPRRVLKALQRELDASGESAFLFRSSFSDEDGASGAAPGVYASVTWMRASGRRGLVRALREVWCSYVSERAQAYRALKGQAEGTPRLAILVQPRLAHDVSGVAASVDLSEGGRERHLIDVEGALWVHDILADRVSVVGTHSDSPSLEPQTLRSLSRLVASAEAHLGGVSEIEWGLEGNRLTLYQARRISGPPIPRTVTDRHIIELPRYPLTPLSHSFLWGEGPLTLPLNAALTPLGVTPLSEASLRLVQGRVMADVSAFKALIMGLPGAAVMKARPLVDALLGLSGAADNVTPAQRAHALDGLSQEVLLQRLGRLREEGLAPLLSAQMRTLMVAATLESWLTRGGAESPAPRLVRPDAGDAWYRAERAAELSTKRRHEVLEESPMPPPDRAHAVPEHESNLLRRWLTWARDRQLSERERLNVEIQVINDEARAVALALDARLSAHRADWSTGDAFFYTMAELAAHLTCDQVLPDIDARRATYQAFNEASVPGVCDLNAHGARVPRTQRMGQEDSSMTGVALGRGSVSGVLRILREGSGISPDAVTGAIVLIEGASPHWSQHVLLAAGVALVGAGPLSHLALLARERGIPLIASLPEGVLAFQDGSEVTLELEQARLVQED